MKNGLITLQIGGKQRTLKFNMRAVEAFGEIKNAGTSVVSSSVNLIYAGLVGACYVKQEEPDFTFEDVSEWVEDLIMSGKVDILGAADKCFSDSLAFNFFTEQAEDLKKKATQSSGQTSTPTPGEQSDLSPESTTNSPSTSM